MPLDTANTDPMYRLGRIAALVGGYIHPLSISTITIDRLVSHPLEGLALLMREAVGNVRGGLADNMHEGVSRLTEGLELPATVNVEETGPFWLGYYHQRHARKLRMSGADLERAGVALYGDRWQSALARDLNINDRRIREYMERGGAPSWIRAEIFGLLAVKSRTTHELAEEILRTAGEHADEDSEGASQAQDTGA